VPAGPKLYLRSYPVPDDMMAHAARVEEDGWDGLLFNDTQNLGMDVFGSLYLAASATSRLELGTAVTNLITRHPAVMASAFATIHHVSGGRAHIGLGRGDTALELVGIKPPAVGRFETLLEHLQAYLRGESVDVEGFQSRITWLPIEGESKVPVDVFGSGPRVIDVGAEPERIRWAVWTARKAREAAGLDPDTLDIGAFVVVGAGTDQRALDELVRGNASISARFQRDVTSQLLPSDATSHYDNYHHGMEHAAQAEEFLNRFCVIGAPEHCTERLCRLIDLGLSHLVFVGGSRDTDAMVRERSDHLVAKEVLPAVKATA
jgi:5,10-methylenetetrahydromethanopterin reductase